MKKLFFILFILPLFLHAQTPVKISNPYIFNKYIKVNDSLMAKTLGGIPQTSYPANPKVNDIVNKRTGGVDTLKVYNGTSWVKLTTSDELQAKQDTLGFTEFDNKYLSNDGTFRVIEPPAGGFANNLYLDTLTSVVVPSYNSLTYNVSGTTYVQSCTVNSTEGDKVIETFLYPSAVDITNYPSGLWSFNFYGKISSNVGISNLGVQYFARTVGGSETTFFTLWSQEINNTTDEWFHITSSQPGFIVNATDRMGMRLLAKTSTAGDKTITIDIGDGYGAYINTPNTPRHSQLRALNGDTAFLHVRSQDTTMWNNKQNTIPNLVASNGYIYRESVNIDSLYLVKKEIDQAIQFALSGKNDSVGQYDASSNLWPSTGIGGGSIKVGDWWSISVGGTLGGVAVTTSNQIYALTSNPGQTASNWDIVGLTQTIPIAKIAGSVGNGFVPYYSKNNTVKGVLTGLNSILGDSVLLYNGRFRASSFIYPGIYNAYIGNNNSNEITINGAAVNLWTLGGYIKGTGNYSAMMDYNPLSTGVAYSFKNYVNYGMGYDGTDLRFYSLGGAKFNSNITFDLNGKGTFNGGVYSNMTSGTTILGINTGGNGVTGTTTSGTALSANGNQGLALDLNLTTGQYFLKCSKTTVIASIDSAGYFHNTPPHYKGQFRDSSVVIALTQNVWYQITNQTYKNTWTFESNKGFTDSGDTVIVGTGSAGHYIFCWEINVNGSDTKTFQYRIQRKRGATTTTEWQFQVTGTGSDVLRHVQTYIEAEVGDRIWVEVRSTSVAPGNLTILGGQWYPILGHL